MTPGVRRRGHARGAHLVRGEQRDRRAPFGAAQHLALERVEAVAARVRRPSAPAALACSVDTDTAPAAKCDACRSDERVRKATARRPARSRTRTSARSSRPTRCLRRGRASARSASRIVCRVVHRARVRVAPAPRQRERHESRMRCGAASIADIVRPKTDRTARSASRRATASTRSSNRAEIALVGCRCRCLPRCGDATPLRASSPGVRSAPAATTTSGASTAIALPATSTASTPRAMRVPQPPPVAHDTDALDAHVREHARAGGDRVAQVRRRRRPLRAVRAAEAAVAAAVVAAAPRCAGSRASSSQPRAAVGDHRVVSVVARRQRDAQARLDGVVRIRQLGGEAGPSEGFRPPRGRRGRRAAATWTSSPRSRRRRTRRRGCDTPRSPVAQSPASRYSSVERVGLALPRRDVLERRPGLEDDDAQARLRQQGCRDASAGTRADHHSVRVDAPVRGQLGERERVRDGHVAARAGIADPVPHGAAAFGGAGIGGEQRQPRKARRTPGASGPIRAIRSSARSRRGRSRRANRGESPGKARGPPAGSQGSRGPSAASRACAEGGARRRLRRAPSSP